MKVELRDGKYYIDGEKYNSFQDIPESVRKRHDLEDRDGNGISDNFDEFHKDMERRSKSGSIPTTIIINGKTYNSWDEIPPELEEDKKSLQNFIKKHSETWEERNRSPATSHSPMSENKIKWFLIGIILLLLFFLIF